MIAKTATALPRPLPRSLAPQHAETLSGYLLNLAHRLGDRPIDLAHRIGLERTATAGSIDTRFAVSIPDEIAARFAHACNLTADEAARLTLARWDGLLFDSSAPGKAARTVQGNGWFVPVLTRACPLCLAETDPTAQERVTWQAAWKTPWAVTCTRHGVMLEDTCTDCGQPFGASGTRIRSLIPNPAFDALHPAACRSRPTGSATLCGSRIDQQATESCPEPLLSLQRRLDGLLDGTDTEVRSLGVPVTPAHYLRDLRALGVLLQLADHRPPIGSLPDAFTNALVHHLDTRNDRRASRATTTAPIAPGPSRPPTPASSPRCYTRPPPSSTCRPPKTPATYCPRWSPPPTSASASPGAVSGPPPSPPTASFATSPPSARARSASTCCAPPAPPR